MGYFQFARRDTGTGVAPIEKIRVNDSQTIEVGDLLVVATGKASKAGAAPTDATVLGVAVEPITTSTATDADQIRYIPAHRDIVWRVPYVGVTKTELTDADLGTAFDIDDNHKLNLDDTTGGFLTVVGYNDVDKAAFVRIASAKLYSV